MFLSGRLPGTAVYIIPKICHLMLFANNPILFSQTLGTPSFSYFCLLPVNIRKRFATSYVKHHAQMYTYSQTKSVRLSSTSTQHILILLSQQRIRHKERKEQHLIPANSLSHSDSKSSTQSNISAAVKMSRNSSNTSRWIQGTEGAPTNPSTYPDRVELDDVQPDPNSASSGSQLAQTSASNPSHHQGNNNQGGNATSGGNNPQMAAYLRQTQEQEPWVPSQSREGFQAQGSTAGTGQGEGQGGVYGGGNSGAGRGGHQNGYADSMSANKGSSDSGRSSGDRA